MPRTLSATLLALALLALVGFSPHEAQATTPNEDAFLAVGDGTNDVTMTSMAASAELDVDAYEINSTAISSAALVDNFTDASNTFEAGVFADDANVNSYDQTALSAEMPEVIQPLAWNSSTIVASDLNSYAISETTEQVATFFGNLTHNQPRVLQIE